MGLSGGGRSGAKAGSTHRRCVVLGAAASLMAGSLGWPQPGVRDAAQPWESLPASLIWVGGHNRPLLGLCELHFSIWKIRAL